MEPIIPTQSELDARERARQAGRALAAQGHAAVPADAAPDASGPLVAPVVEILRADPEPAAAAPTPAPAPAPAAPVLPVRPNPAGLRTDVWLRQLALFHGAVRVGPRSTEGDKADGQHRAYWRANDTEQSADFTTATAARLFMVDAADDGVLVELLANAAPIPDSASPAPETAPSDTTGPETEESAVRPEKGPSSRVGTITLDLDVSGMAMAAVMSFAEDRHRAARRWRFAFMVLAGLSAAAAVADFVQGGL